MGPPRIHTSLTLRLVAGVLLSQLLLAGGLMAIGIRQTRRQLADAFDTGLRGHLMSVAAVVRYPEKGTGLIFDATLLPAPESNARDFYEVLDAGGGVIATTFPASVALPAAAGPATLWKFSLAGVPYRGLRLEGVPLLDTEEDIPGPPPLLTVAYAQSTAAMRRQIGANEIALAGASLLVLALAALLAAIIIRRELDPLRDLARQAAGISPRHWSIAPAPRTAATAELAPLIAALDSMLGRLQASFRRQREFLADAAHELKTPVAILKSSLQSLLQRPRPEADYRAAAAASLQDVERLEQLLARMLRLARSEQLAELRDEDGAPPRAVSADLAASCAAAVARVRALAQARAVTIACEAAPRENGWSARADADDLETVWVNLLENAVQHSPEEAVVTLRLDSAEGSAPAIAVVTVADCGAGISAADLPLVFERFRRGAAARARPGFGLGLAIAKAIVEGYGGAITLESQIGAGTTVEVRLPLA